MGGGSGVGAWWGHVVRACVAGCVRVEAPAPQVQQSAAKQFISGGSDRLVIRPGAALSLAKPRRDASAYSYFLN
jgi:hypothetical protein